jgi:hypothetical protein
MFKVSAGTVEDAILDRRLQKESNTRTHGKGLGIRF